MKPVQVEQLAQLAERLGSDLSEGIRRGTTDPESALIAIVGNLAGRVDQLEDQQTAPEFLEGAGSAPEGAPVDG